MIKRIYLGTNIGKIKKVLAECNFQFRSFLMQHIMCFGLLVFSAVISIYSPSYIGNLVDSAQSMQYRKIALNLIALVFLSIFTIVMDYLKTRKYNKFEMKLNIVSRSSFMKKITCMSSSFWEKYSVGDIDTLLDKDLPQFSSFLVIDISSCVSNLILFIGLSLYLFWINVKIGGLIIALVLIFVIIQKIYTYPLNKRLQELKEIETLTNTYSNDILNNIESYYLKDNAIGAYELYVNENKSLFEEHFKVSNKYWVSTIISQSFNIISIIMILSIWILDENMQLSSGQLINIILYSQRLYVPLFKMGEIFLKYKTFNIILNRIYSICQLPIIKYGSINIDEIRQVRFINLNKEMDSKTLFANMNVTIDRGDIIGITGPNGSGKTTLIKLLRKFDESYKGKIFLNEVNLNDVSQKALLDNISVMPQKIAVSSDEISTVIEYMNKNDINSFIDIKGIDRENIYNYTMKSGGELQKISLLKTLSENKNMIVLDEPTSSMDLESEIIVGKILDKIRKDKIILIITHRKHLLSLCNQVVDLS